VSVRRRKIRFLVKELLEHAGVHAPPVPVDDIARSHGLELRLSREPASNISGFLFLGGEKPIVGINAEQHPNRQRFTIAHELGHFLLHGFTPQDLYVDHSFKVLLRDDRSSDGTDETEREANLFAAELLMPIDLLQKDLQDWTQMDIEEDEGFLRELAQRYQVSQQAMMFRLANLAYVTL
jgi:Zn-dependent peptidase ImmA (M78 family)